MVFYILQLLRYRHLVRWLGYINWKHFLQYICCSWFAFRVRLLLCRTLNKNDVDNLNKAIEETTSDVLFPSQTLSHNEAIARIQIVRANATDLWICRLFSLPATIFASRISLSAIIRQTHLANYSPIQPKREDRKYELILLPMKNFQMKSVQFPVVPEMHEWIWTARVRPNSRDQIYVFEIHKIHAFRRHYRSTAKQKKLPFIRRVFHMRTIVVRSTLAKLPYAP